MTSATASFVFVLLAGACREQQHHHDEAVPAPSPVASATARNPLQLEMQLLATAIETGVRGIGVGDVRQLEHALHRVHAAKGDSEAALESGKYRPPKNPERVARFQELDREFHQKLEHMVAGSRANDVQAVAVATAGALQSCQGCHAEFRR
jgi:cytochrome c556